MCDPVTIAGIALSAASVVTSQVAAGEQTRARDSVLAAERIRQNQFDQQAQALNQHSQDSYVNFVPQQEAKAASLGDTLAQRVNDPNSGAAGVLPSSTSSVVNQETAKQEGNAQGYVDQQTGATAKLRSFGDLLGEKSLLQGRDASQVAQIGGFKQGSAGVVPLELDNASHAGDNWNLLADILGGGGQVATSAGINGGSSKLASMFASKPGSAWTGGWGSSALGMS
jgi:hypothetical protein